MKQPVPRVLAVCALLVTGCVEGPLRTSTAACPGPAAVARSPTSEAGLRAVIAPPSPAGAPAEPDAGVCACDAERAERREMEDLRVALIVLNLGHPDVALRHIELYEKHYVVRERTYWELIRLRALLRLGRVQEAEAGARFWKGTETGRWLERDLEEWRAQEKAVPRRANDPGPDRPGTTGVVW